MKEKILNKYGMLMLMLSGLVTALPLVFEEIGFIQWLSIMPMAWVLTKTASDKETKLRKIYLSGLVFFESYFLVVFHWFLAMYPLEFTGISKPVAVFVVLLAWIGVSLLEAALYALSFLAFAIIARLNILKGIRSVLVLPAVAGALWVVFEWIQTLFWWGVPWGRLCLGQINAHILLGSASVLGSYFITFIIVAVNFFAAYALSAMGKRKTAVICSAIAILLFCLNLSLGAIANATYKDGDRTVRMAAIQGNNPNSNIWQDDTFDKVMDTHIRLTQKAAKSGAEIVVWSETAFPYSFFETYRLMTKVSQLAKETNITILVSAFTEYGQDDKLYVSLIEVKPDGTYGEVEYHKQKLVPFGEIIPMRELIVALIPPLGQLKTLENDLIAGDQSLVLDTDCGKIGVGICYDSIFEEVLRSSANNGAELFVVSTNDSWFGESAALDMHNSQSALRAIEFGKYVVRSANTGVSSIISPKGEIMQSLPASVDGYIVDDVCLNTENTVYSEIGNIFVYACIAFLVVLILSDAVKNVLNVKSVNKQ